MKHSIEVDISGMGITLDTPRWMGAESLVAEGDTLEELLNNASIWFYDQDGGEGPCLSIDHLNSSQYEIMVELIKENFKETE